MALRSHRSHCDFRQTLLLFAVTALALIGCDVGRYELKEDKSGRTIRLDKWTGEITIIAGDRLIKVKTTQEQESERILASSLAQPKRWNAIEIPQLEGAKATLVTSWRDNVLEYQFSIRPIGDKLVSARRLNIRARFMALLYDDNSFRILAIELPLSELASVVDDKGKVMSWDGEGSIPSTGEQYRRAVGWNLKWIGFGPS